MHNFMIACRHHMQDCAKGISALRASTASLIRTDGPGHAQASTPARLALLPVFPVMVNQRAMVWDLPIDIGAGNTHSHWILPMRIRWD